MTFDDGIVKIFRNKNIAELGDKPIMHPDIKASYYFGFEKTGITRYYEAMKADKKVNALIHIWQDRTITEDDTCVLNDEETVYNILQTQHGKDEYGLNVTWLTLQKNGK